MSKTKEQPERKKTVWLDVDGVLKDDIMDKYRKLGLPEEGRLKNKNYIYMLRLWEEGFFAASALPLRLLSMLGADPTKNAQLRQEVIEDMKVYTGEGAEIRLITANKHVNENELKRELKEQGIEAKVVKVEKASDKWRYISKLEGEHILLDDNPYAFIHFKNEKDKAGIIMRTPYYGTQDFIVKTLKGVNETDADGLREMTLRFLRTSSSGS